MKFFICDTTPLVPMSLNSKEKHVCVCELSGIWLKDIFDKFHKVSRGEKHEEEGKVMGYRKGYRNSMLKIFTHAKQFKHEVKKLC